MRKILILLIVIVSVNKAFSGGEKTLHLPSIISDNMVLQQQTKVSLWGWASPNSRLTIKPDWLEQKIQTQADINGYWITKVKTGKAISGKTHSIIISDGKEHLRINNIVFGEVWLASGQSNMEMPLEGFGKNEPVANSEREIAESGSYPIRMFTVEKDISETIKNNCKGNWQISTPQTAGKFSATAYFFAKFLHKKLGVPIGIIHSSWGGTPIESWMELDYLEKTQSYKNIEQMLANARRQYHDLIDWLSKLESVRLEISDPDKIIQTVNVNDNQYASVNFDASSWEELEVPGLWNSDKIKDYEGIIWIRKEFEIPADTDLKGLTLHLGKIDEMDETYVNDVKIGSHLTVNSWTEERQYPLPENLLKPGKNVISIKIYNTAGAGGIYGIKSVGLFCNDRIVINLSGRWKYKPAALFFKSVLYKFDKETEYNTMPPKPKFLFDSNTPTLLYNAMIAPLIPFTIKGVIWYQGESNVGQAKEYEELFPTLITNWRENWQLGPFPFYYVQIAPFKYSENDSTSAAELRWAQFKTLDKLDNLGMVVTTDIGDVNSIHPANKEEVGRRLSLWALNQTYHFKDIECSGPLFKSCIFKNDRALISFSHVDGGLICKGTELTYFEMADSDNVYRPAKANISGNKIVVKSEFFKKPAHVRFGWRDDAQPNFFNKAGLPASPFKY